MTPQDAARLGDAFRLLQGGRGAEALAIAQTVAKRAPRDAEPQHMLALCRKALGDDAGAVAAFDAVPAG